MEIDNDLKTRCKTTETFIVFKVFYYLYLISFAELGPTIRIYIKSRYFKFLMFVLEFKRYGSRK